MSAATCPACGAPTKPGDRWCKQCGFVTGEVTVTDHADERLAQRRAALKRANQVRDQRFELRRAWKAGGRDMALREFAAVVVDPPAWLASIPLETLESWLPGVGVATVRGFTNATGVHGHLRLAALTPRQRDAVLDWAEARRSASPGRALERAVTS